MCHPRNNNIYYRNEKKNLRIIIEYSTLKSPMKSSPHPTPAESSKVLKIKAVRKVRKYFFLLRLSEEIRIISFVFTDNCIWKLALAETDCLLNA